jgi:hypothetical protein
MSPEEAKQAAVDGVISTVEMVDPSTSTDHNGHFSVSGLVVLPIGAVSPYVNANGDVELADEAGTAFGTLCFTRRLIQISPQTLTKWQYAAYLAEVDRQHLNQPYEFRSDYVVVDAMFVDDYIANYMAGAPLWGGFTHDPLPSRLIGPETTSIAARRSIVLPTQNHRQSLNRYIEATNAFDRFLKLYHALELLFDFVVMKQIRGLGDDLAGFGKIISSYNSKELERLRHLISMLCDEPEKIARAMCLISKHTARAQEIFQDHSKDGNPLKDERAWNEFMKLAAASQLTEKDIKDAKAIPNRNLYSSLVVSIAAYWIYRVRSSIAHNRVGEFLFMEIDEAFVAEFAEPLLLEIVWQVFSGPNLKRILV